MNNDTNKLATNLVGWSDLAQIDLTSIVPKEMLVGYSTMLSSNLIVNTVSPLLNQLSTGVIPKEANVLTDMVINSGHLDAIAVPLNQIFDMKQ